MSRYAKVTALAVVVSGCFGEPPPMDAETDSSSAAETSTSNPSSTTNTSTTADATTDAESSTDSEPMTSGEESGSSSGGIVEVPEPYAAWHFDGDMTDATGNGYDGLVIDNVPFAPSPNGMAAVFESGAGYLDLSAAGNAFLANIEHMTITAVIQPETWDPSLEGTPYPGHMLLGIGFPDAQPENNAWLLDVSDYSLRVYTETGNNEPNVTELGQAPAEGEWHRITVTVDGDVATYYVDGGQVAGETFVLAETPATELRFGGWGNSYYRGLLDDLALYAEPLSPAQVAAL